VSASIEEIEEVVKVLDSLSGTLHTRATLVRHAHWGVARGSDLSLGQGLEPLTSLEFYLTLVKQFSILSLAHLLYPLVSAHSPLYPTTESRITLCSSAFFAFRGLSPQFVANTIEASGRRQGA
jgi:hypothetical protein